jgi:hypothetical protein
VPNGPINIFRHYPCSKKHLILAFVCNILIIHLALIFIGIVVGFGAFFSIAITALSWVQKKYGGVNESSEEFSTAGRSVKIGLLASSVVSAWTWAATLLQSSSVAYTVRKGEKGNGDQTCVFYASACLARPL